MGAAEITALVVAGISLVGVILSYTKYKPGQKEVLGTSVAERQLNIAQGTINLVTDELEQQFKRMAEERRVLLEVHNAELAQERTSAAQLRSELTAATNEARQLRSEVAELRAEVAQLRHENDRWKRRVSDLEDQLQA
jgi:predicted RNase H-like nuclease (RuvC/YqgF family)